MRSTSIITVVAWLQTGLLASAATIPQGSLDARDTPGACWDTCNAAQLEQNARKNDPAICNAGSAYRDYYDGCVACVRGR